VPARHRQLRGQDHRARLVAVCSGEAFQFDSKKTVSGFDRDFTQQSGIASTLCSPGDFPVRSRRLLPLK
jgi:hypothetical protein